MEKLIMAAVDDLRESLKDCSLDEQQVPREGNQDLLELARNLQCPFTWKPGDLQDCPTRIMDRSIEKIEEIADDEGLGLPWFPFILNLVLCYELYRNSVSEAFMKLMNMENTVSKGKKNDDTKSRCIELGALEHITLSSKFFLLMKLHKYDEARTILESIKTISCMSRKEQASIWGVRTAMYMEYGQKGTERSLEFIEHAIELDENNAEWYFLKGKALRRLRRYSATYSSPDDKELRSFEKANELGENAAYMVFLAQDYRELSASIYASSYDDYNKYKTQCENLNSSASTLYKDALHLGKDFTHINIRCAQGFFKLPSSYRDLPLARKCIDTALRLAPNNPMANHWAGKIYEHMKEFHDAEKYYRKASDENVYGASMDLIRFNWTRESGYDPLNWDVIPEYNIMSQFEDLLERYPESSKQMETNCQIGSYWYFIKNNFKEALNWWKKVLDDPSASLTLKVHKCTLIGMKAPINLNDVIFDEAQMLRSSEDREEMDALIEHYLKSLLPRPPIEWRTKILTDIKNEAAKTCSPPDRDQTEPRRVQNWREENRGDSSEMRTDIWSTKNRNNRTGREGNIKIGSGRFYDKGASRNQNKEGGSSRYQSDSFERDNNTRCYGNNDRDEPPGRRREGRPYNSQFNQSRMYPGRSRGTSRGRSRSIT